MDKHELDIKMTDMAKSILSYCMARTSNHFEAEDLAQDIIVEIYKSADNIRNADAFYGFMWAVAGNVYKQWYKKKAKNKECEITDSLFNVAEFLDNEREDLHLLRRELALLSEEYRKAVILYYIENKSCSEISKHLAISESMVKYLLHAFIFFLRLLFITLVFAFLNIFLLTSFLISFAYHCKVSSKIQATDGKVAPISAHFTLLFQ